MCDEYLCSLTLPSLQFARPCMIYFIMHHVRALSISYVELVGPMSVSQRVVTLACIDELVVLHRLDERRGKYHLMKKTFVG